MKKSLKRSLTVFVVVVMALTLCLGTTVFAADHATVADAITAIGSTLNVTVGATKAEASNPQIETAVLNAAIAKVDDETFTVVKNSSTIDKDAGTWVGDFTVSKAGLTPNTDDTSTVTATLTFNTPAPDTTAAIEAGKIDFDTLVVPFGTALTTTGVNPKIIAKAESMIDAVNYKVTVNTGGAYNTTEKKWTGTLKVTKKVVLAGDNATDTAALSVDITVGDAPTGGDFPTGTTNYLLINDIKANENNVIIYDSITATEAVPVLTLGATVNVYKTATIDKTNLIGTGKVAKISTTNGFLRAVVKIKDIDAGASVWVTYKVGTALETKAVQISTRTAAPELAEGVITRTNAAGKAKQEISVAGLNKGDVVLLGDVLGAKGKATAKGGSVTTVAVKYPSGEALADTAIPVFVQYAAYYGDVTVSGDTKTIVPPTAAKKAVAADAVSEGFDPNPGTAKAKAFVLSNSKDKTDLVVIYGLAPGATVDLFNYETYALSDTAKKANSKAPKDVVKSAVVKAGKNYVIFDGVTLIKDETGTYLWVRVNNSATKLLVDSDVTRVNTNTLIPVTE